MNPVIAIVGAGPGLGLALARRFGKEGFAVALLARNPSKLDAVAAELTAVGIDAKGFPADAAEHSTLRAAWNEVVAQFGAPEVVVYNASSTQPQGPPTTLDPADVDEALAVNVTGALVTAQLAAPSMRRAGHGTILLTGSGIVLEPSMDMAALGMGKAALRNLSHALAVELRADGVHVATVTIGGTMQPGTRFAPDVLAELAWDLSTEAREQWRHEVVVR